ncbi:MAG: S-layer homology domain-containing protein [Acidimicrobiia bacterium]|nr:S-layer homology domain-containing protein [Acidimicrobiia bacterium]
MAGAATLVFAVAVIAPTVGAVDDVAPSPDTTGPETTGPDAVQAADSRSVTYVGTHMDRADLAALGIGQAGYWFAQFDAPAPVENRPTHENDRDALPQWAGPLNHFSIVECDIAGDPAGCLEAFLTRTFSQDGPTRAAGGQPGWATLTLPSGETGQAGAVVDPHTVGNSNNTINRIQLGEGVPEHFTFHVVVDTTATQHDPTNRLRPRGNIGESPVDVDADWFPTTGDHVFNGVPDVHSFRFDGFQPGDYLKLQLNGDDDGGGASIAGFMFDTFECHAFIDVRSPHPFCEAIDEARRGGVLDGWPRGEFRPGLPASRQAVAAALWRSAGRPAVVEPGQQRFTDVRPEHPFAEAIAWLADTGLAEGYPDGSFRPDAVASRQAVTALLWRVHNGDGPTAGTTSTDVPSDHPFAAAISWALASGVAEGYPDGSFRPAAPASRQAFAAWLAAAG